jgi:hypothetical protein
MCAPPPSMRVQPAMSAGGGAVATEVRGLVDAIRHVPAAIAVFDASAAIVDEECVTSLRAAPASSCAAAPRRSAEPTAPLSLACS